MEELIEEQCIFDGDDCQIHEYISSVADTTGRLALILVLARWLEFVCGNREEVPLSSLGGSDQYAVMGADAEIETDSQSGSNFAVCETGCFDKPGNNNGKKSHYRLMFFSEEGEDNNEGVGDGKKTFKHNDPDCFMGCFKESQPQVEAECYQWASGGWSAPKWLFDFRLPGFSFDDLTVCPAVKVNDSCSYYSDQILVKSKNVSFICRGFFAQDDGRIKKKAHVKVYLKNDQGQDCMNNDMKILLCKHDNIINFMQFGSFTSDCFTSLGRVLVMEAWECNLADELSECENKYGFSEQNILNAVSGITDGVCYIKSINIKHNKINLENIVKVINDKWQVVYKISNFESAVETSRLSKQDDDEFDMAVVFYNLATGCQPVQLPRGSDDMRKQRGEYLGIARGAVADFENQHFIESFKQLPEMVMLSPMLKKVLVHILTGLSGGRQKKKQVQTQWTVEDCKKVVDRIKRKKSVDVFFAKTGLRSRFYYDSDVDYNLFLAMLSCFDVVKNPCSEENGVSADDFIDDLDAVFNNDIKRHRKGGDVPWVKEKRTTSFILVLNSTNILKETQAERDRNSSLLSRLGVSNIEGDGVLFFCDAKFSKSDYVLKIKDKVDYFVKLAKGLNNFSGIISSYPGFDVNKVDHVRSCCGLGFLVYSYCSDFLKNARSIADCFELLVSVGKNLSDAVAKGRVFLLHVNDGLREAAKNNLKKFAGDKVDDAIYIEEEIKDMFACFDKAIRQMYDIQMAVSGDGIKGILDKSLENIEDRLNKFISCWAEKKEWYNDCGLNNSGFYSIFFVLAQARRRIYEADNYMDVMGKKQNASFIQENADLSKDLGVKIKDNCREFEKSLFGFKAKLDLCKSFCESIKIHLNYGGLREGYEYEGEVAEVNSSINAILDELFKNNEKLMREFGVERVEIVLSTLNRVKRLVKVLDNVVSIQDSAEKILNRLNRINVNAVRTGAQPAD